MPRQHRSKSELRNKQETWLPFFKPQMSISKSMTTPIRALCVAAVSGRWACPTVFVNSCRASQRSPMHWRAVIGPLSEC